MASCGDFWRHLASCSSKTRQHQQKSSEFFVLSTNMSWNRKDLTYRYVDMRLVVWPKVRVLKVSLTLLLDHRFTCNQRSLPFQRRIFASFFLYPCFDWISARFFPPTWVVQLYQTGLNFLVLWLDDRQLAVWVTPCVCGNAFLHISTILTHSVNLRAKKLIKKDSGTYQGVFCRESHQVRICPKGAVALPPS